MVGGAGSGGQGPTGRYVVVFRADVASDAFSEALASLSGASSVASSLDYEDGAIDLEEARAADAAVCRHLGLAVVSAPPEGADLAQRAASDPRILAVEPERILH